MTVARHERDTTGGTQVPSDTDQGQDPTPPRPHAALGLADGLPGLCQLMDRLLAEDGCPWDRAQTLASLRPYLLEEAHEVLEAMDDPARHVGELGDLLFQIVFQSALRGREGAFGIDEVIAGIRDKMIERHPHVFGPGREGLSAEEVQRRWEQAKHDRRVAAGEGERLEVPPTLPALQRSSRLQDKAAALGFDWPDVGGAIAKLHEELAELMAAHAGGDPDAVEDEFGDLLFVAVRVAGKLGVDPEVALRRANAKFERRFAHVLKAAAARDQAPAELGLAGLDALWDQAKRAERAPKGAQ